MKTYTPKEIFRALVAETPPLPNTDAKADFDIVRKPWTEEQVNHIKTTLQNLGLTQRALLAITGYEDAEQMRGVGRDFSRTFLFHMRKINKGCPSLFVAETTDKSAPEPRK